MGGRGGACDAENRSRKRRKEEKVGQDVVT